MDAYLVLENGDIFKGEFFGKQGETIGEVVFTTAMTGYLETLTDPSYYGQIILQTFPLIGNYGIIPDDFESSDIFAKAYVTKYPRRHPSNFRSIDNLDSFLKQRGIVGLCGIDTRLLTKTIRKNGVMNGKIMQTLPGEKDFDEIKAYTVTDPVSAVSNKNTEKTGEGIRRVALMDFGCKRGIVSELVSRDCEVHIFPHNTPADEILKIKPSGVMLSNGPGDPANPANTPIIDTIKILINRGIPIFGICLGHQLLALANGYSTEKLKFGHRGANQPVKDTKTKRVYISSQNHGYTVIADNSSYVNVNDGTCEGLDYGNSFSVQFHPEGRGGPHDTSFLFDRFTERMEKYAG